MRNFAFLGDGSFETRPGFGVFIEAKSLSGTSVGWPSWMPIRITEIGIEWPDINNDPSNFVLTLSAAITGLYDLPFTFTGAVDGIKIDLGLLAQGKFPIIDIAGIAVGVEGDMFGGRITGALIGGIVKLDVDGNMIGATDSTTPVNDRVFFVGIQGGYEMPGMVGFTIRLALSELGPLGVTITSAVPGGIIIEPISGLALNDFTGGVEFFKSLPSVTNPSDLRLIPSASGSDLDAGAWLDSVKLQVVTQYKKIKTGAIEAGFTAAFTSPMIISGGAKVFDAYATKESFNGDVEFQISTDGKFLLRGTLNFASDLLSLKATIYADLSHIASGSVTVLFLADIPEQFRFLVIAGKFQMGFKGADGNP